MHALRWLFAFGLFFAGLNPALLAAESTRPNLLIVLVDDAGYGDFGCHGQPFLKTPNIDRLHDESVRFTDFHVAPMCTPTRGQLMTGLDALHNGATSVTAGRAVLRPGITTLPQYLAAGGYRTGLFGKWHLGDSYPHRPIDKGFQTATWVKGWGFTSAPEFTNSLFDGRCYRQDKESKFSGYITDVCFHEAIDWMGQQQQAGQPFFCYLPLHAAHAPYQVPDKYKALFAGKPAPGFFGMLANIDENMGRLEDFLKTSGLRDNTIVVFMTDNGGTAGVKVYNAGLRAGKTTYWDGGHRVPCFVRWPAGKLRQPADVSTPTQIQDLLPTLLELCSVQRPAGKPLDGSSLVPLLRGTGGLADRMLVVQYGQTPAKWEGCVIWNQWRLIGGKELYDTNTDRAQAHNVADEHSDVVSRMREHYERWWSGVEGQLNDFVPFSLGAEQENPVLLTSSDWENVYADNSNHIRNGAGGPQGGVWAVNVERPGEYEISLSRWPMELSAPLDGNVDPPGKAFPIAAARLRVGSASWDTKTPPGAKTAVFQVQLPAGRSELQAWFQDAQGQDLCGAFYVQVKRTGG